MDYKPEWKDQLELGDRFREKLEFDRAVDSYLRAARDLFHQGHFALAAAVCVQTLGLEPNLDEPQMMLEDLHRRLGVSPRQAEVYRQAGMAYERERNYGKAREVIRILIELKPKKLLTALELAELYQKAG